MARILVAEDDPKQADLIKLYLERDGHSGMVVGDGRTAYERIREVGPYLVILELMRPRMDGLYVTRAIRMELEVPIVLITARSTEDDILLGLDLGADDYITKPFSPRQMAARVRAVLRRSGHSGATDRLSVGPIDIDRHSHEIRIDGNRIECTPKEFAILETLADDPGRAFSRQHLLERAFGFDYYGLERTVDVHVMRLRKKMGIAGNLVETVRGVGYRLRGDDA